MLRGSGGKSDHTCVMACWSADGSLSSSYWGEGTPNVNDKRSSADEKRWGSLAKPTVQIGSSPSWSRRQPCDISNRGGDDSSTWCWDPSPSISPRFSSFPIGAYKLGMCSLRNGVTVLLMSVDDIVIKRECSEGGFFRVSGGACRASSSPSSSSLPSSLSVAALRRTLSFLSSTPHLSDCRLLYRSHDEQDGRWEVRRRLDRG